MNNDKSLLKRLIVYAFLILLSCAMLLPFLWLLRSSVCDDATVTKPIESLKDFLPPSFHWENYPNVLKSIPLLTYLANTVFIAVCVIVGSVISSSLWKHVLDLRNFDWVWLRWFLGLESSLLVKIWQQRGLFWRDWDSPRGARYVCGRRTLQEPRYANPGLPRRVEHSQTWLERILLGDSRVAAEGVCRTGVQWAPRS